MKTNEISVKKLSIKGKYSGFTDFYDTNKVTIYKNIINLFGNLKNKEKNKIILVLSAKIMDLDWETELKFGRQEITVLIKDLIPYFESIEDYETCGEIHNLYLELSSI
jgi:hypothetical protein